jgi:hypothetical protein
MNPLFEDPPEPKKKYWTISPGCNNSFSRGSIVRSTRLVTWIVGLMHQRQHITSDDPTMVSVHCVHCTRLLTGRACDKQNPEFNPRYFSEDIGTEPERRRTNPLYLSLARFPDLSRPSQMGS